MLLQLLAADIVTLAVGDFPRTRKRAVFFLHCMAWHGIVAHVQRTAERSGSCMVHCEHTSKHCGN
jgi:hypothetical protein